MFENEKLFAFFLCALAKQNKKDEFRRRKELWIMLHDKLQPARASAPSYKKEFKFLFLLLEH